MEQNFTIINLNDLKKIEFELNEIKKLLLDQKYSNKQSSFSNWISEKEVMLILGVKKTTLYNLRRAKILKFTKTRPILYSVDSINRYLKGKMERD